MIPLGETLVVVWVYGWIMFFLGACFNREKPKAKYIKAARAIVSVNGRMGNVVNFYNSLDLSPVCNPRCPGFVECESGGGHCDCLSTGEQTLAAARRWLADRGLSVEASS